MINLTPICFMDREMREKLFEEPLYNPDKMHRMIYEGKIPKSSASLYIDRSFRWADSNDRQYWIRAFAKCATRSHFLIKKRP